MRENDLGYIYSRSSKDKNDVSCSSQSHELELDAHRKKVEIVKRFEDKRLSATKDHLDGFTEMLEKLKSPNNKVRHLFVYQPSRLGRDLGETSNLIKELRFNCGIKVHFLHLPSDDSPETTLFLNLLMSFDQYTSQIAAMGAKRGQRQNIRDGVRAGGEAGYGYRREPFPVGTKPDGSIRYKSRNVPDPETSLILKEWANRVCAGESTASIFRDFEARKIPSPSGKKRWNGSTASHWLKDIERYTGTLIGGKHRIVKKNGIRVPGPKYHPREKWEINEHAFEPLITQAHFEKLSALREKRKHHGVSIRKERPFYLLKGLLQCPICGDGVFHGDRGFYCCSSNSCKNSNIKQATIEQEVVQAVGDEFFTENFFAKAKKEMAKKLSDKKRFSGTDLARLKKQKDKLLREIDKLYGLFANEKIDEGRLASQIHTREEDVHGIDTEISKVEEKYRTVVIPEINEAMIRRATENFYEKAMKASSMKMYELLHLLFAKIELGPKVGTKNRWKRNVRLSANLESLTRVLLASPTGFEPVSPA